MIHILEDSKGDLVAFRVYGHVNKQDYDVMLPLLEEKIRQYGRIRVYAELQEVEAYTMRALYEDLKFDLKHATHISRAAIVGSSAWIDWLAVMARPFTTANIRYFDFSQRDAAWEWVQEGLNLHAP